MRENIFTQVANAINAFAEHKINKEQLYNQIVTMIEIASENEKQSRKKYQKEISNTDFTEMSEIAQNFYFMGLNLLK